MKYHIWSSLDQYSTRQTQTMDILALGWVSVLALFTWSIAMVVWGRNGF